MPLLTIPLALAALAALPALASIYWLRNRYRRRTVSSLLLWADQRQAREGGLRVEKFQTPLSLLLELLVLALLALAAADPRTEIEAARRPLAVILDDSFSMLAGGDDSPRSRALAALRDQLADEGDAPVTLIAAGPTPQVIANIEGDEAGDTLSRWICRSVGSDLSRAVALAGDISHGRARLLVLTDHEPPGEIEAGRVQWWAFGRPRPNIAFVNAVRSPTDDRVFLELANFSDQPAAAQLSAGGAVRQVRLAARQRQRLWLDAPAGQPLRAVLSDDALLSDNHVELLPEAREPVRVRLDVADPAFAQSLRLALEASGRARFVADRAELVLTDQPAGQSPGAETWIVRFLGQVGEPTAYVGPFVLDRAHRLTQGLALTGTIWAVGQPASPADAPGDNGGDDAQPPGRPVIMAGNQTLVSERRLPMDRRELVVRLWPELSTLRSTPNFPILLWNLLDWRAAHLPGLERANIRVGMEVALALPREVESVRLQSPTGEPRDLAAADRIVTVRADGPGTYTLRAPNASWSFVANTLAPAESDLSAAAAGQWGRWIDARALRREYRSLAWALLLPAVGLLLLHGYWIHRTGRSPS